MHLDFRSAVCKERGRKILTVRRFERAFQRDLFRFNPFSTFQETNFDRVRMQFLSATMEPHILMNRNGKIYF